MINHKLSFLKLMILVKALASIFVCTISVSCVHHLHPSHHGGLLVGPALLQVPGLSHYLYFIYHILGIKLLRVNLSNIVGLWENKMKICELCRIYRKCCFIIIFGFAGDIAFVRGSQGWWCYYQWGELLTIICWKYFNTNSSTIYTYRVSQKKGEKEN